MSRAGCLFLLLPLLALPGCGESATYCQVSGKVQAGGKPVEEGMIIFSPVAAGENQRPVVVDIVEGAYSAPHSKKMTPGEYRVAITAERPTGRKIETDPGSGKFVQEREQFIPAKYNAQSELTASVTGDTDSLNFELQLPRAR